MLPVLDIVVLVVYVVAVVGLGCWFATKSDNREEFIAAGRSLPGWAVGLSIFGTYLSSNTFLGVPGKAYATNWNAFVFSLSLPVAAFIAVRWFVPFYRRSGAISAYQHLEHRFGPWARLYVMVLYLLVQISRVAVILYGVALALQPLTGWSMPTIIIAAGVLITLYTVLGGIEAVIWTDVVQSIVLTIGAAALLVMLLVGTPGGPMEAIRIANAEAKFDLGSLEPTLRKISDAQSTVWIVLLFGLFENLKNFGIDQSFVQRYHTAKDDGAANRSVWLGAMLYVPISLGFFAIGSAAFAYYETHPEMLAEVRTQRAEEQLVGEGVEVTPDAIAERAATLGDSDVGDAVLPHFIVTALPPGCAGLLLAAIFAAAMSSIDTSLNSSATVVHEDVWIRYVNPDATDRQSMAVLHAGTIVFGVIGTTAALAMIGQKSVLDAWWKLSGTFAGGMLGLFLLGMLVKRANGRAAAIGVVAGTCVFVWMTFSNLLPESVAHLESPFDGLLTIVGGTLTIILVGAAVAPLTGSRPASDEPY